ncbi:MAG: secretin N-terminal domain-containing protein [Verrucomicrobiota bacterium]
MKAATILTITTAVFLGVGMLPAQTPVDPQIEPVAPAEGQLPEIPAPGIELPKAAVAPDAVSDIPPPPEIPSPGAPGAPEIPAAPGTAAPFGPLENQKQEMQKSDEGFIIKDAALNDIFQFLSKSAAKQYFHNTKIGGPEYLVTGHLNDGNPLQQMEELAFMYGLSLHTKGNTIYALTQAQLSQLPSAEFHYQLRYLRPTDIEQIKELIKPMLSPGTGIVNYEPKTNTVIIIDSAHRIEEARSMLHGIDKEQGQIIVETKILRINTSAAERTGINWSSSLGKDGTDLTVFRDLNSVFGLPSVGDATAGNLVLSPVVLRGVLRALADGGLASQVSNPTLITEDNEQATISIIDRVPIITTTTTAGTATSPTISSDEVRYKIDTGDKTIDTDPENHREIGISMVVTPTLLPDGTIRMKMRPRSAQVIEEIVGASGNKYPRVTEAMLESIARVPNGHSLVVGGFYGETRTNGKTKIPLLGDLPMVNFFFKSKDATKEKTSLVFVVTPKSYNPASGRSTDSATDRLHSITNLDCDYNWVNPDNPGPAHEPNLKRTIRSLQPTQAPYYPRPDELEPRETAPAPASAPQKTQFSRAGKH